MFDWKITKISTENDLISHAHYICKLINEPLEVATEGTCYFSDKKPVDQVQEQDIVDWIEKESMQNGVSTIKLRLQEQMKALENEQSVALPWLPKTFKLKD
jgi:hypothetical protein